MNYHMPYFAGKKAVYVGNAREKTSLQTFLSEHGLATGFDVISGKTNDEVLQNLKSYDKTNVVFVKSPRIPGHMMPCAYTTVTRIFFDCLKQLNVRSVGVVGTKGKTTTASLIAHILKDSGLDARLCEGVGEPMLDTLKNTTNETVMIVELSSYQLAELRQNADVAVVTNLYKDHIAYHGNLEAVMEARRNIMRTMQENNALIYNPETEVVLHWLSESQAQHMPIDPKEDVDMSQAKLIGDHNRLNYLMAKKAASLFGVSGMNCAASLATFEPVAHRLQQVRTARGITFFDDAIGSTPEATIAGIKAIIQNRGPVGCVMLGGTDCGNDFSELVSLLQRVSIPKLVFFPDTGMVIESLIAETEDYKPDTFNAVDMDEAVQWAYENTPSGSVCLLSTAAPSTVLWKGFEEKGTLFQKAVMGLPN